jgi:membrane-associated phospholipid phosphatase
VSAARTWPWQHPDQVAVVHLHMATQLGLAVHAVSDDADSALLRPPAPHSRPGPRSRGITGETAGTTRRVRRPHPALPVALLPDLARFLVAHRTIGWTRVFTALTDLGGAAVLAPLTGLLAAVIAWRSRSWRPVWVTAVALDGVQLLVFSLKLLVGRPRPAAALAVAPATGFSFPSGHSTSSFVAFTILAWLAMPVVTSPVTRAALWVLAGLLIAGVGLSRMYLGVHYLTDVVGAWILAATWLSALWTSLALAVGLYRTRSPPAAGGEK